MLESFFRAATQTRPTDCDVVCPRLSTRLPKIPKHSSGQPRHASIVPTFTTSFMASSTLGPTPETPRKHHLLYKGSGTAALLDSGESQQHVAHHKGTSPSSVGGIAKRY